MMQMKKTTAVLLAALMLSSPAAAGSLTDATVQSYEEQLTDLQNKMQRALDEIAEIRADSSNTLEEIRKYDEAVRYNGELKKLEEAQLDTLETQIADAEAKIADAEERITKQEKAFENRMVASYMKEDIDFFEMLLSSKSLTDFLVRLERVTAVLRQDKEIIRDLEENRETLAKEQKRLLAAQELRLERVKALEAVIEDSRLLAEAKERYMQSLEENESAWLAVYTANAEAEKELNAQLETYLAEQQAKTQAAYVGGALGWPLETGAYYFISSEQGWRTLDGVADNHYGIDIACAAGTDILAANTGTVLISEYHWSYGEYVLIDHGGGLSTLYAHMSDRLVSAGDTVAAGQQIGNCGLTGNTKGYHLHFEVRENGQVINPRNYIVLP